MLRSLFVEVRREGRQLIAKKVMIIKSSFPPPPTCPQHFQLALIDSNLCTLSKAESKYYCYNYQRKRMETSRTLLSNAILDLMYQLVGARWHILKRHRNISTKQFRSLRDAVSLLTLPKTGVA